MTPEQIASTTTTLWDDRVTGLHVRVAGAKKAYYLYYRTKLGRQRRPKLGDVGTITLTKARELARAMLVEVASGNDPVDSRRQVRDAMTLDAFWEEYKATDAPEKTLPQYEFLYKKHVSPQLGGHRLPAIQRADIERIHRALSSRPYQANRVVALLGVLFSTAERRGHLARGSNPARGIRRYPEPSRERYATPEECRAVLAGLARRADRYPRQVGFLMLMLFTGARPDEIVRGRREWIHGTTLRLPDSKTGRRVVHLSPQALAIIEWLAPHVTDGTLTGLVRQPHDIWYSIRAEAGCPDLRIYDLRHTFASAAIAATGSLDLTGRLLGHTRANTTLIYAHLMTDAGANAAAATGRLIEQDMLGGLALPAPKAA